MDRYVVVVEVDNKRASAAYQKGLADLELIWPQLMEHAESVDAQRRAEYEKQQEQKCAKLARDEREHEAYRKARREWEEKTIFRGPAPTYPIRNYDWGIDFPPSYLRDAYESIRAELQHMADLAGAAISAYRMTETQVREMVGWENGSRLEQLKNWRSRKPLQIGG